MHLQANRESGDFLVSKDMFKEHPVWRTAPSSDEEDEELEIVSTNVAEKALMRNLIDYCENVYARKIKRKEYHNFKFLRPEESIQLSLNESNYIPVLEDIWNSGNTHQKILKIKKLIKEDGPFHAPLMFELSLLFYQNASLKYKIETAERICLPLINAAWFRAMQDAECSISPEGGQPYAEKIQQVYYRQLDSFLKNDFGVDLSSLSSSRTSLEEEKNISATANKTLLADKLPNPCWIAGLNMLDSDKGVHSKNILPNKYHKSYREEFAKDFILHSFLSTRARK